jgi:hypothetical protein
MMATLVISQNLGGGGVGRWERERKKKTLTLIGLTHIILSPNPTQMPSLFPNGQIQKKKKKRKKKSKH